LTTLCLLGSGTGDAIEYDLQPLAALSCLVTLVLDRCALRNMAAIGALKTLHTIAILRCYVPDEGLAFLPLLPQLEALILGQVTGAGDLECIAQVQSLESLRIMHTESGIQSLAPLSSLTRLSFLGLESCGAVTSIDPLTSLAELTTLRLGSCPLVSSLIPLGALPKLQQLWLQDCPGLLDSAAAVHALLPDVQVWYLGEMED
jgi:hypothetical protein